MFISFSLGVAQYEVLTSPVDAVYCNMQVTHKIYYCRLIDLIFAPQYEALYTQCFPSDCGKKLLLRDFKPLLSAY